MNNNTYTIINHRDNITLSPSGLYDALTMASLIYDGAGIKVDIINPLGEMVKYSFNSRGLAMLNDNLARMS
jgi:hypothetical protein